jgi:hypothetical protein
MDELQRRLDSALRAMNEADQAMRNGGSAEEQQRAADEARRQLEGARDRASEAVQRAMQASVNDLAERADELHKAQQSMEDKLMKAIRGVNVSRNADNRLDSGLSVVEEYELADEKRRLQADVQQLEQDARNAAQQLGESQPRSADEIRDAIEKLRDTEVESRLAIAAAYIEQGEAVYIVNSEGAVTQALRELSQDLERASAMAESADDGEDRQAEEGSSLAETLAQTQELRRQLQRMAEGNPGSDRPVGTGRDDRPRSTGIEIGDIDISRDYDDRADRLSDDVVALFRDFRGRGVAVQDLDELRRLAADVRAYQFSGNPALLEEEARRALSLVEQLELALSQSARGPSGTVRTTTADEVPEEHRRIVADYYRRLGHTDDEPESQD